MPLFVCFRCHLWWPKLQTEALCRISPSMTRSGARGTPCRTWPGVRCAPCMTWWDVRGTSCRTWPGVRCAPCRTSPSSGAKGLDGALSIPCPYKCQGSACEEENMRNLAQAMLGSALAWLRLSWMLPSIPDSSLLGCLEVEMLVLGLTLFYFI